MDEFEYDCFCVIFQLLYFVPVLKCYNMLPSNSYLYLGGLDSQVGSVVRQSAKVPGSIPGRRKSVGHRWNL